MFTYWGQVIRRALGSSLNVIGQSSGSLAFAGLLLISAWGYLYLKARRAGKVKDTPWRSFRKRVLEPIFVPVIFWTPVFLWYLVQTPYLMQKESQQQATNAQSELRRAPTKAYVDDLQKEIEGLRNTLSSRSSNSKPCFHPLDFKEERLEPTTMQFPHRRRITISSSALFPKPRFWIYTDVPAGDHEIGPSPPCNWGSFGGNVLDYYCRQPIGPNRSFSIVLSSEQPFSVVCIENKSTFK